MLKTVQYILSHPISRIHPMRAILRYLRWQIGSRILRYPIAVPFIERTHLVVEPSMTGATGNIYCGLHEFCDMAFVLHFLRPTDVFVDVGANIGSYTVLASGVVGCRSISFEPVPRTFDFLERNLNYNNIQSRVRRDCCAVGAAQGEIRFSIDCDTTNRVVSEDYSGESQIVPVKPLDELLANDLPSLWKVDVEGFEEQVLAGARNALNRSELKAVLLESDSKNIEETMSRFRFQRAKYSPFSRSLSRKTATAKDSRPAHNQLWVRDDAFETIQQRCQGARIFEVHGCRF